MQPLVNMQIAINEISIKSNQLPHGEFEVVPKFTRKIQSDDTHYSVTLALEIINSEEHPFPFDIRVSLTGTFDANGIPEENLDTLLKIQVPQILFPYVRAIVSNLTASSFMPPVILPIIDIRNVFSEDNID